ncbi:hypothetical protein CJ483_01600 [Bacillus sp. PK3_68]|nr:hypothetical protein CJ483_01600 [Bacillus sp. PK3_68]
MKRVSIHKKSDIVIIVAHEIYGVNRHMRDFCELLTERGFDVICPNLLEREAPFDYEEEAAAYRHFIENVGFVRAARTMKRLLIDMEKKYKKVFLIGFSVGATVAWLCSEEKSVDGIIGYYGSRIRDYLSISPQCPVLLFFPQEEPSFSVDELIKHLRTGSIQVHQLNGQHGFSDPYSPRYDTKSAQTAFNEVIKFIG